MSAIAQSSATVVDELMNIPQRHLTILAEREDEKARGDLAYIPWELAREQLRQMVSNSAKSSHSIT
jgi:hypothetical protein